MEKILELISEQELNIGITFLESQLEKYRLNYEQTKSEYDVLNYTLEEMKQKLQLVVEKEDVTSSLFIPNQLNENQLHQEELKEEIRRLEEQCSMFHVKHSESKVQVAGTEKILLFLKKLKELYLEEKEAVPFAVSEINLELEQEESSQEEQLSSDLFLKLSYMEHKIDFIEKLVGVDVTRTKIELMELKSKINEQKNALQKENDSE